MWWVPYTHWAWGGKEDRLRIQALPCKMPSRPQACTYQIPLYLQVVIDISREALCVEVIGPHTRAPHTLYYNCLSSFHTKYVFMCRASMHLMFPQRLPQHQASTPKIILKHKQATFTQASRETNTYENQKAARSKNKQ